MNRWTKEHETLLRDNYRRYHKNTYPIELVEAYGLQAIYTQASRMKLTKPGMKPFKKPGLSKVFTPTEAAYIAGLIDGEGWITVQRNMYYQVGIGMTHLGAIEWLRETVGEGSFKARKPSPSSKPTHKPRWELCFNGSLVVRDFLMQIIPYMIVKKEKAQEAIDYIDFLIERSQSGREDTTEVV